MTDPELRRLEPERRFGPFRLLPARPLLLDGADPVRLGTRALTILAILVERAGEVVGKDEIIARAWAGAVVDDASLRMQIAALRKALRDGEDGGRYVATLPGRGYCFVAPVSSAGDATSSSTPEPKPVGALPPMQRLVGRAEIVATLVERLPQRRCITLVGPGGIGKTSVALAVAHALAGRYRDQAHFIDLAPLADPSLVASTIATAVGASLRGENPANELAAILRDREALLIVDNCERVVDALAPLAEAIVKDAVGIHILATSREPLLVEGEHVWRLGPLDVPPIGAGINSAKAIGFPAVQLFVERATASLPDFDLTDANAGLVAEICHRLDGLPLAVELAAGLVDALGVAGIAAGLEDRFQLLVQGRRTAMPRQRTLLATLDWSHDLLSAADRIVFSRLAVFAGGFSLAGAVSVAATGTVTAADVANGIANLVTKSLVVAQGGSGVSTQYRLLDSTRAYALQKLLDRGERPAFARRHATHYRDRFERAGSEWERTATATWLTSHRADLDDVRIALDWAFKPDGDVAIGVALTAAAVPLWLQLSLVDECLRWVERALAVLDAGGLRDDRRRMTLSDALAWSLMYTGTVGGQTGQAWATALALAEALGDTDYRLRALWGIWTDRIRLAEFAAALAVANEFCDAAAASNDPADRFVGDRMAGTSLHFLGDQAAARARIERVLTGYVTPVHGAHVVRFQFDQRVSAGMTYTRILWLQGFADQAMRAAEDCVAEAIRGGHALSLCNALAQGACPVALLTGDLVAAERFIGLLRTTARPGLAIWRIYGDCYEGSLHIRRGAYDAGLELLQRAADALRASRFMQFQSAFLVSLAEGLVLSGQLERAAAAIEEALRRCEQAAEGWLVPELLRLQGEIASRKAGADAAARAAECFEQARGAAQRYGALAWELRATVSLVRLRGRPARELLANVVGRFAEGFDAVDLRAAQALLGALPTA